MHCVEDVHDSVRRFRIGEVVHEDLLDLETGDDVSEGELFEGGYGFLPELRCFFFLQLEIFLDDFIGVRVEGESRVIAVEFVELKVFVAELFELFIDAEKGLGHDGEMVRIVFKALLGEEFL